MSAQTQSPQRRRPPPQGRDTSRSPSMRDRDQQRERPRTTKAHSMPLVPFAHPNQQASPQSQSAQGSPNLQGQQGQAQVTRLLPTPPHPLPSVGMEEVPIHAASFAQVPVQQLAQSQPQSQQQQQQQQGQPQVTHYPRPIRMPATQFLAKYQHPSSAGGDEDERYTVTEELLMDIERADFEAAKAVSSSSLPTSLSASAQNNGQGTTASAMSPHGSASSGSMSPHSISSIPQQQQPAHSPHSHSPHTSITSMSPLQQQQSQTQSQPTTPSTVPLAPISSLPPLPLPLPADTRHGGSPKEAPKLPKEWVQQQQQWRRPSSPLALGAISFGVGGTPERRGSPLVRSSSPLVSGGGGGSPGVRRERERQQERERERERQQTYVQPVRTPDRSLPVQEEAEDDTHTHPHHQIQQQRVLQQQQQQYQQQNQLAQHQHSHQQHHLYSNQLARRTPPPPQQAEETEGEEGTPRSPSAALPEEYYALPQQQQQVNVLGRVGSLRGNVNGNGSAGAGGNRGRNGSFDGVGMRGIEGALGEHSRERDVRDRDVRGGERQVQGQVQGQGQYQPPQQPPPQQQQQQQQYRPYQPPTAPTPSNAGSNLGNYPHVYPDDFPNYADDTATSTSSYIQSYLRSPRPEAPVPPTPHSQTAPSPSPFPNHLNGKDMGRGREEYGSVPPVGSPYPYPFGHVRRIPVQSQPSQPSQQGGYYDPQTIQEQMAKQLQMYAQNHISNFNGNITDSTFSPASTPFPQGYDPWVYLHMKRTFGQVGLGAGAGYADVASIRSSPSHEPVLLPPAPTLNKRKPKGGAGGAGRHLPPRVESTQPRETSPELSSSGDETAGEDFVRAASANASASRGWNGRTAEVPGVEEEGEEDDGDWVDEDEVDGDEEDLLQLEYHPSFVRNVEKRRRRWESGWEGLVQAFRALDRQTDTTMILLASPSHTTKLHTIRSRSIRREPYLAHAPSLRKIKKDFKGIASVRRNTRTHTSSLIDRFLAGAGVGESDSSDGDGSDRSREEDLKRALETALGSLGTLGSIYEQREARWAEEMRRVREERERVEILLRQVLGDHHKIGGVGV